MKRLGKVIRWVGIFLLGDPANLADEHRRAQYTLGDWNLARTEQVAKDAGIDTTVPEWWNK